MLSENIFLKIISKAIPAKIIHEDDVCLAFNDINPQAPTHVLLIPTIHTENAAGLAKMSPTITADLFTAAAHIAAERELDGYRTVFNTGADAGQTVFHAHLHLLGGRGLAWPPG